MLILAAVFHTSNTICVVGPPVGGKYPSEQDKAHPTEPKSPDNGNVRYPIGIVCRDGQGNIFNILPGVDDRVYRQPV